MNLFLNHTHKTVMLHLDPTLCFFRRKKSVLVFFSLLMVCARNLTNNRFHTHTSVYDLKLSTIGTCSPPRVLFFEDNPFVSVKHRAVEGYAEALHPTKREMKKQQKKDLEYRMRLQQEENRACVSMAEWQSHTFANCNLLHEVGVAAAGTSSTDDKDDSTVTSPDTLTLMGHGYKRHAWRLDLGTTDESVLLKTLQFSTKEFDEHYLEQHRSEASALERLTSSSSVIDIYGYCGQSVINELASFDLTSAETNLHLKGRQDAEAQRLRLKLASSVAIGVSDVHVAGNVSPRQPVSMAHHDLKPSNIVVTKDGTAKLHDFDSCGFVLINPALNKTCGFYSHLRGFENGAIPGLRHGEHSWMDEKVDVYALGKILSFILFGKYHPKTTQAYTTSSDASVQALLSAIKLCLEQSPAERPPASEIAKLLLKAQDNHA